METFLLYIFSYIYDFSYICFQRQELSQLIGEIIRSIRERRSGRGKEDRGRGGRGRRGGRGGRGAGKGIGLPEKINIYYNTK